MDQQAKFFKQAADREEHIQALDRAESRKSLISRLFLLIALGAFAAGGYFGWEHYKATWGGPAENALAPAASTAAAAPATPQAIPTAIIGEDLLLGDVSFTVIHGATVPGNAQGVDAVVVLAHIGNAGKRPISAVSLTVHLIDRQDRMHAPLEQTGRLPKGVRMLNPGLQFQQFWVFAVDRMADFVCLEVKDPTGQIAHVDLTERTPENRKLIDESEEKYLEMMRLRDARMLEAHERKHTARIEALNTQLERAEAETNNVQIERADLEAQLEAAHKATVKAQREAKGYESRVKDYQRSTDRAASEMKAANEKVAYWKSQPAANARDAGTNSYKLDKAQQTLAFTQNAYDREKGKLAEYTAKHRDALRVLQECENTESSVKGKLDRATRKIESLTDTAEKLREQLGHAPPE